MECGTVSARCEDINARVDNNGLLIYYLISYIYIPPFLQLAQGGVDGCTPPLCLIFTTTLQRRLA